MHRLRAWGIAALLAGLGGVALAQDPDDAPPPRVSPFNGTQNPAYRRWVGAPAERPKPPPPLPTTPVAGKRAAETAGALRAQEEANLLRRLAVCDRLMQLAVETNDDSIEKEADRLQQKAQKVFRERCEAIAAGKELAIKADGQGGKK
ncbi:MAG: hypothetical protein U0746_05630 [Gemmataceae bacterium]